MQFRDIAIITLTYIRPKSAGWCAYVRCSLWTLEDTGRIVN